MIKHVATYGLLLILTVVGCIYYYDFAFAFYDNRRFDSQVWQSQEFKHISQRITMIDDLNARFIRKGMSEAKLRELLGEPNEARMNIMVSDIRRLAVRGMSMKQVREYFQANYPGTKFTVRDVEDKKDPYYRRLYYSGGMRISGIGYNPCRIYFYLDKHGQLERSSHRCS